MTSEFIPPEFRPFEMDWTTCCIIQNISDESRGFSGMIGLNGLMKSINPVTHISRIGAIYPFDRRNPLPDGWKVIADSEAEFEALSK